MSDPPGDKAVSPASGPQPSSAQQRITATRRGVLELGAILCCGSTVAAAADVFELHNDPLRHLPDARGHLPEPDAPWDPPELSALAHSHG